MSTLIGLAASNLGLISSEAKAYSIVLEFLLPLAVPLLLFRADLRRVIKSTGKLLLAFLLGSGNSAPHRLLTTCVISLSDFTCFTVIIMGQDQCSKRRVRRQAAANWGPMPIKAGIFRTLVRIV